jgi:hypothetical protein
MKSLMTNNMRAPAHSGKAGAPAASIECVFRYPLPGPQERVFRQTRRQTLTGGQQKPDISSGRLSGGITLECAAVQREAVA